MKEKNLDEVTTRVAAPAGGGGCPLQMSESLARSSDILILY